MSPRISVIVRVQAEGPWPADLVESLDDQTLRFDDYETVFAVADAVEHLRADLTRFAAHRPNVSVVGATDDDQSLVEQTAGDWLLDLGPVEPQSRLTLYPAALEELLSAGAAGGDLVVGRTVLRSSQLVNDVFVDTGSGHPGLATGVGGPVRLVAVSRACALTSGLRPTPSDALKSVVLQRYPVAAVTAERLDAKQPGRVGRTTASWRDGMLLLSAELDGAEASETGAVVFSVQDRHSGLEYWVPTATTRVAEGLSGTAELDVHGAALGRPLSHGLWRVTVGVHGTESAWSARVPVDVSSAGAALTDGVAVVSTTVDGEPVLDIGGVRTSLVGAASPSAAAIQESARGTLLSIDLPSVAVSGRSRIAGSLLLDKFALPAHLVAENGGARLECFLSGLPGTSTLSTRFGAPRPTPLGLTLTISGTGLMSVAKTQPKAPASAAAPAVAAPAPSAPAPGQPKAAKAASSARHRAAGGGGSVVRTLRRHVPTALEPAARALSRNPVARRIYRRLVGL